MNSYRKICLYAIIILIASVLLSACRSEIRESTAIRNDPTTGIDSSYQSTATNGSGENDATANKTVERATEPSTPSSVENEATRTQRTTTAPASTTTTPVATTDAPALTTTAPAQYKEWSYWSASGYKVTYTENPDNKYIALAAEQLGVPANKLSASYNSKGATVFLFSSSVKSEATLTDCFIIFSEKMTIEENIRKDGSTGSNKALADILYKNAMKKEP